MHNQENLLRNMCNIEYVVKLCLDVEQAKIYTTVSEGV